MHFQGLLGRPGRQTAGDSDRRATAHLIAQLGYIQIDTLAVVERAHHHTLWTRNAAYQTDTLNALVRDREIFEYWFHAAAYLPMRDYRFALRNMAAVRRGEIAHFRRPETKMTRYVLDRIRDEGPLKARDFETAGRLKQESWWNWSAAKYCLERLFMQGDLMIVDRQGMQKVYELRERFLPDAADVREPPLSEFAAYLIDRALDAHGFTTLKQILHLRSGAELRQAVRAEIEERIAASALLEHSFENLPPLYARPGTLDARPKIGRRNLRLLSPFDNAVIHRDRVEALFGFQYRLECYTPAAKRRFGYFCLPVLYGDALVGRVDCKAHRKDRVLELIHLHIEDPTLASTGEADEFAAAFAQSARNFADFNQCDTVKLTRASPAKWLQPVRRSLKQS